MKIIEVLRVYRIVTFKLINARNKSGRQNQKGAYEEKEDYININGQLKRRN